jgi:hypothetical protein
MKEIYYKFAPLRITWLIMLVVIVFLDIVSFDAKFLLLICFFNIIMLVFAGLVYAANRIVNAVVKNPALWWGWQLLLSSIVLYLIISRLLDSYPADY